MDVQLNLQEHGFRRLACPSDTYIVEASCSVDIEAVLAFQAVGFVTQEDTTESSRP